jgi:hypothetical protein
MARPAVMNTREFLWQASELVRLQTPPPYRDFHTLGPTASLIKLHFGNPKIHYEIWLQRRHKLIEVGLHFEDQAPVNKHYLTALTGHAPAIRDALGPAVEAEQWTDSWTRLHQSILMTSLDEDLLLEVADATSRMISVLEPLVRQVRPVLFPSPSDKCSLT